MRQKRRMLRAFVGCPCSSHRLPIPNPMITPTGVID